VYLTKQCGRWKHAYGLQIPQHIHCPGGINSPYNYSTESPLQKLHAHRVMLFSAQAASFSVCSIESSNKLIEKISLMVNDFPDLIKR